jgi:Protein of unknown function (DUF2975)
MLRLAHRLVALTLMVSVVGALGWVVLAGYAVATGGGPLRYAVRVTYPPVPVDFEHFEQAQGSATGDHPAIRLSETGPYGQGTRTSAVRITSLSGSTGEMVVAFPPGLHPMQAALLATVAISGAALLAILNLLRLLLGAAAAGRAFTERSARQVRSIGLVIIGAELLGVVGAQLVSHWMPGMEAVWLDSVPRPAFPAIPDFSTLAVGALVVAIGEIVRQHAAIAAEHDLTV